MQYDQAIRIIESQRKRALRHWENHGKRKKRTGFRARERLAYAIVMEIPTYNNVCECCGRWIIKTHLHHIDGNPLNNEFSNLVFLSPACHYQAHRYLTQGVYMVTRSVNNTPTEKIETLKGKMETHEDRQLVIKIVNEYHANNPELELTKVFRIIYKRISTTPPGASTKYYKACRIEKVSPSRVNTLPKKKAPVPMKFNSTATISTLEVLTEIRNELGKDFVLNMVKNLMK